MFPDGVFELIAFVLGLLLGSFLNVCISRLPRHESVVGGRSRCPECRHTIHWFENIPLLSFVLLRARCRHCKKAISWRYPFVELAYAVWFLRCANRIWLAFHPDISNDTVASFAFSSPIVLDAVGLAVLGFLLLGLLVTDWETQRLPDVFTLTGVAMGFFLTCVQAMVLAPGQDQVLLPPEHMRLRSPGVGAVEGNMLFTGPEAMVLGRIGAIVAAALLLLVIRWVYLRLRGREGMGLGDVKLIAMIAAFLGLEQTMLALFVGVLGAAFFASVLLARGRAGLATRLPFGSFLAAGGLFAAAFGSGVLGWYTGLFR